MNLRRYFRNDIMDTKNGTLVPFTDGRYEFISTLGKGQLNSKESKIYSRQSMRNKNSYIQINK